MGRKRLDSNCWGYYSCRSRVANSSIHLSQNDFAGKGPVSLWKVGNRNWYKDLVSAKHMFLIVGVVAGSTSGIGRDFAEYLASKGMSVLIISRTESKLIEQTNELKEKFKGKVVDFGYLAFDFTKSGEEKEAFYKTFDERCQIMDKDGGIGLLINNVGTANEYPKVLHEFTDKDIDDMINCNVFSTINMSRAVLPFMKAKKNGAVVSISSGSGNGPSPMLTVYSATK